MKKATSSSTKCLIFIWCVILPCFILTQVAKSIGHTPLALVLLLVSVLISTCGICIFVCYLIKCVPSSKPPVLTEDFDNEISKAD